MKTMDEKLLRYYIELKGPEAGEWNSSPQCLHAEMATREYVRKNFGRFDGMQVCNVGIGTGDWDDYLGYWLKGIGKLTSIDIDAEICEIFEYRQRREGHPNASKVLCKSIFDPSLPAEAFDLVTLIGSSIDETGEYSGCLDACFRLLKSGGYLMLMANARSAPFEKLEQYMQGTVHHMVQKDTFTAFPEYPFYICKIKKKFAGAA
ncbi:class I SAM-dependent methyltransferase [Paenibacillus thermotolerans]|uniref:class I SAM-dependent methyltransferase n=1 Tax=Paenibacillus thermotolerans TaxID=3027807 RepID=UPI002368ED81|nr:MULTISPECIES: methyltransferase domain-containing protein [unclassified Paenibacillus]